MTDAFRWVGGALEDLDARGLRRHLRHRNGPAGVRVNGMVSFSSNDYLGLAGDPRVGEAAAGAARRWGGGSAASRLITGGTSLHRELEQALAAWKGSEDAVVFSSGYLANTGTIPALVSRGDAVFSDALNHASIVDGCRLSGAQVVVYRHRDHEHLQALLDATPAHRRLIVTDGVFSMDGDTADLPVLRDIAAENGAMLLVDDAHGCGVLGAQGRGTAAAQSCDVPLTIGTLSKAFGAAGGYVTGPHEVCEWLRNRARTFVFDTAPAPAVVAAAMAGVRIATEEPWRRERATSLATRLAKGLAELGGAIDPPAACIVPLVVGSADAALRLSSTLREHGIDVAAIRPPSVPDGTSRLRFVTTAAHAEQDVDAVLAALHEAARN